MPKMVFIEQDGTRREVEAPLGLSVLEIARRNDIDLEGACEGSLACSTCHVVVSNEWYELLAEATEDEEDMLDLAFGLTKTSRLGCQIKITEELDGLTVALPAGMALGTEKVACSLSASSATVAVCTEPAAVMVTDWKAISAAFSVMEVTGSLTVRSMVSSPAKVAAFRSGARVSV